MIKFRSLLPVAVLSILLTACGTDNGGSAPQQLTGRNPGTETTARGDFSHPKVEGTTADNQLARDKAEDIMNGAVPLVIEFSSEVDPESVKDKIQIVYKGKTYKCGDQTQVEGKRVQCILEAQEGAGEEVTLSDKEKLELVVKPGLQSKDGQQQVQQDTRQHIQVGDGASLGQVKVSLLAGNESMVLDNEALANLTSPDSVVETYVVTLNGKVDEQELKQSVVIVDPQGNMQQVQDVSVIPAEESAPSAEAPEAGMTPDEAPIAGEAEAGEAPADEPTPPTDTEEPTPPTDTEEPTPPTGDEGSAQPAGQQVTQVQITVKKSDLMGMGQASGEPQPDAGEPQPDTEGDTGGEGETGTGDVAEDDDIISFINAVFADGPAPEDPTAPTPDDPTAPTPDDPTAPTPDDPTAPAPEEPTTPAPTSEELAPGVYKLIIKKGLKVGENQLEQDHQVATIEVRTEGAGAPAEGTEGGAANESMLMGSGPAAEDNKLSTEELGQGLTLQVKRGEEARPVFGQEANIDASYFNVQQMESAESSTPVGEAKQPQSVQVVDESTVKLTFAEGDLQPGHYQVSVAEDKLKDEGQAIQGYKFEVVQQDTAPAGDAGGEGTETPETPETDTGSEEGDVLEGIM